MTTYANKFLFVVSTTCRLSSHASFLIIVKEIERDIIQEVQYYYQAIMSQA